MSLDAEHTRRLEGCLLGTAAGDALGLPAEGLTPERQRKLYPRMDRYQLLWGGGLISDDTEHAVLTLGALRESQGQLEPFQRLMRQRLRRWFWTAPPGVGYGTLKAGVRLSLGLRKTGVFSAGNGPAMRAPIIAAWCFDNGADRLQPLLRASTEITHTDPKAYHGSLVLGRVTHQLLEDRLRPDDLTAGIEDDECLDIVNRVFSDRERPLHQLCQEMGLTQGVSGYIYHTLALVLQAVVHKEIAFEQTLIDTVRCGGDSDSTAALVGGILGAVRGPEAIPAHWREGLRDWPLGGERLTALARDQAGEPSYPSHLARNLALWPLLVGCALRRVLPPY